MVSKRFSFHGTAFLPVSARMTLLLLCITSCIAVVDGLQSFGDSDEMQAVEMVGNGPAWLRVHPGEKTDTSEDAGKQPYRIRQGASSSRLRELFQVVPSQSAAFASQGERHNGRGAPHSPLKDPLDDESVDQPTKKKRERPHERNLGTVSPSRRRKLLPVVPGQPIALVGRGIRRSKHGAHARLQEPREDLNGAASSPDVVATLPADSVHEEGSFSPPAHFHWKVGRHDRRWTTENAPRYAQGWWDAVAAMVEATTNASFLRRKPPEQPSGSDIWSSNKSWVKLEQWHPVGVISNINDGRLRWNDVSFFSWRWLFVVSALVYPVFPVILLVMATLLVGFCLENTGIQTSPMPLSSECLCPRSRVIYELWCRFCQWVPALLVFGLPVILLWVSWSQPQEIFVSTSMFTSVLIFLQTSHMLVYALTSLRRVRKVSEVDWSNMFKQQLLQPTKSRVHHWIIIPQYKEDFETVAVTMRSICQSTLADSMISVVLAMEERESDAEKKAQEIKDTFGSRITDLITTYHPTNLPNDPPGKASNVKWAFQFLQTHFQTKRIDTENVILTVADADSEFHRSYFECLTQQFLQMGHNQRRYCIWQSPIYHMKNYHRQPCLVAAGTMMTCMSELATLGDPHAMRFPYSTYSMSYGLADTVGGWDSEWIAEDWHMGIKCFFLTWGVVIIEPVHLPTVNYTPEDSTWLSTVMARWVQAKRHALGFSDMTYYFMMLPLVFSHSITNPAGLRTPSTEPNFDELQDNRLADFSSALVKGFALCMRLVTVHVMIGVLSTYCVLTAGLKIVMQDWMRPDRQIFLLITSIEPVTKVLCIASMVGICISAVAFLWAYTQVKQRVEGPPWRFNCLHLFYIAVCLIFASIPFMVLVVLAVWKAALAITVSRTFTYEVALKSANKKDGL